MSKRRKKKLKNSIKIIIILLIVGGCAALAYPKLFKEKPKKIKNKIKEVIEEKPKDKVYKARLIAGGDALIHNAVRYSALNDDGSWDFNSEFDMIRDILSEYDIKYYNQESMINGNDNSYPSGGGLYYNTPSAYGEAALNAGFNLISLANNHSMDTGKNGALGSVNYWKTKQQENEIIFDGMTDSEEMRNNYDRLIGEANGITYGFLAYTTSTNGNPVPGNMPYLVNVWNKDKALNDINALRDKVDVLIVSVHWGIEYILEPNAQEKEIAQFLADNNVDIVIGNHAHCIQPIDKINNTIVFYALGNLMSNQGLLVNQGYGQKVIIGALGTLDITKTVTPEGETSIVIDNVGADLTYTYSSTVGNNLNKNREYMIIPFSKMEDKYLTVTTSEYKGNLQKLYDDYKAVLTKYNPDIKVAELQSRLNN